MNSSFLLGALEAFSDSLCARDGIGPYCIGGVVR